MLVHAYLTDGFVKMAMVFLKSLHHVQGTAAPLVWLDTRGLNAEHVFSLLGCYPNERLHINIMSLPLQQWAEDAGVPVADMKVYKKQCEQRYVSSKNRVWKLMTAGDDRVQCLYNILWSEPQHSKSVGPNWDVKVPFIAHFDIDTLFRKPLTGLPQMMQEADIWLKLRPNNPIVKARITIDCIFVKPTDMVREFFDRWRRHINRVAPAARPIGWGQASCWHAFQEVMPRLNYKRLPLTYGLPGRNQPDDTIWTGNVHKLAKDDCAKLFTKEMDSWRT